MQRKIGVRELGFFPNVYPIQNKYKFPIDAREISCNYSSEHFKKCFFTSSLHIIPFQNTEKSTSKSKSMIFACVHKEHCEVLKTSGSLEKSTQHLLLGRSFHTQLVEI